MIATRLCLILLLAASTVVACSGEGTNNSGALFITSTPPGAEVFVNGEPKGFTPLTVRALEPADYEVVLRKDGFQDAQVITSVKPRQTSNVVYALRTERAALTHRFAFISNRDGAFDILTADQTGADVQRWTSLRWQHAPLQAVLASDGSSLAASVESTRGVQTWLINAPKRDSENAVADARALGSEIFRVLQWTPDNHAVLLKNLASGTLWLGSLTGNLTQLPIPNVPRGVLTGAITPDGKSIAFVQKANTYNAGDLWIMNADGSSPQRLSLSGSQDFEPVWAHDNQRIVFVHRENLADATADQDPGRLAANLWLIDLLQQSSRSLTAFSGKRVRQPSIALDDQTVTFVSNQTGADEIWTVDLRGGDPHPLSLDRATAAFPLWLW